MTALPGPAERALRAVTRPRQSQLPAALISAFIVGMPVFGGLDTIWARGVALFLMTEGLHFIGVIYNLMAVGLIIMIFVIFVLRGIAGIASLPRGRMLWRDWWSGSAAQSE